MQFQALTHPDFHLISTEKMRIKIQTIRELIEKLHYHSHSAKYKLALIDDAECMTESAANALLKTLEEPTGNTIFFLISSNSYQLLPTIRSRCQHIRCEPLNIANMNKWLSTQDNIPSTSAARIIKLADGSIGRALELDTDFITIILDRFFTLLGHASSADIIDTSQTWASFDITRMPLIFDIIASIYRDMLLSHIDPQAANLTHPEVCKQLRYPIDWIENAIQLILQTKQMLSTHVNKQLMFEQLLFSLTGYNA